LASTNILKWSAPVSALVSLPHEALTFPRPHGLCIHGRDVSSRLLAATKRAPRIVLRSSWQTVNIGDIGHTPGVLALIEKHIPEADVTLWPRFPERAR
jgi:hypothetical protein